jgi:hypothetical protein
LYNTHEHEGDWTKRLKSNDEDEILKQPCLTILVASNEVLFNSVVQEKDRQGGFVGRILMIREEGPKKINSLMYPPKDALDPDKLAERLAIRLTEISQIKGEFNMTDEARKRYHEWYHQTMSLAMSAEDKTGAMDRLGAHVLKSGMLISMGEKDELVMTIENIEVAINKCEECMPAINTLILTSANGDNSRSVKAVLLALIRAPNQTITRTKLLSKLQLEGIDSILLNRAINTLQESNMIEKPRREGKEGKIIVYEMTNEGRVKYNLTADDNARLA